MVDRRSALVVPLCVQAKIVIYIYRTTVFSLSFLLLSLALRLHVKAFGEAPKSVNNINKIYKYSLMQLKKRFLEKNTHNIDI